MKQKYKMTVVLHIRGISSKTVKLYEQLVMSLVTSTGNTI